VFNAVKKFGDTDHAIGGVLGMDTPYRQNHFLQMQWQNTPEEVAQAAKAKQNILSKSTITDHPGWSKGRYINNYQEGIELGLTPKNETLGADLQDQLNKRQALYGQQTLKQGLEAAHPGQVTVGNIPSGEEGVGRQLAIPYGRKITLPADIANTLNSRVEPDAATGLAKGYDKFNGNWKNLKLGGGLFHGFNTFGSWMGNQIASGKIFTHPSDTVNVMKSFFSKDFVEKQVQQWHDNGQTLLEDKAGLNANYKGAQGDIKSSGIWGNIPGLKQLHEAVFSRQIPFMMKSMFHQQIEDRGIDTSTVEGQNEAVKIAKQINQQFGSFNRDIQGVTPRTARLASRGVLAWDWNEGQVRTLVDAMKKGGVEGKLARQTVFGKALLFGGLAAAAGGVGGEYKGKTASQTALDILQKTVDPSFKFGNYTVGLPTTQVSEIGKPIAQEVSNAANGKSLQNPIKDFASGRLAAVPSAVEQLSQNRNFSGNTIHGTDYYGRPISNGQTAMNLAGMVSPIPLAQGLQAGSGAENVGAAIANTLGLHATPTNNLNYAPVASQTYVARLKAAGAPQALLDADTQFFTSMDKVSSTRSKTITAAETAIAAKNTTKAKQILDNYNQKLVASLQPWQQAGGEQYFDSTMLQLLKAEMIQYKTPANNISYVTKTNPTSIGVSIGPLGSQPNTTKQGG
jgi:hypothetical protein